MPEAKEDNRLNNTFVTEELPVMMAMNFDLDGFWNLDQFFSSDPPTSFILPTPEQSLSPLWGLTDDNNNNELNDSEDIGTGNDTLTFSGTAHQLFSDNCGQASRNPSINDIDGRLPTPNLEVNPSEYQDATCIIKERMTMALRYLIELGEKHVLAQVWAPVKNKGRIVLTTSGQPFVLDPNCTGLHQYRMASLMYSVSLDDGTDGVLELVGRVFKHKLPEWTPNVQYYSDKEYQRLNHALSYDVRGTLALPVFEPSGKSCVGVLELILTSQKISYAPEVDKVCKALEAVNLKSSNILDSPNTQICNEGQQQALAEILEVMAAVCETYSFPFAQTWVPCRHRSVLAYGGGFKKSCSSFDRSCMGQVCMSTTDVAFYIVDAHMWGFREACAEHHLQKGQGVAGRAFLTRSLCFCENITHFGKTEYPLVHYARLFGLVGSFAICLRSSHTGDDDYVLEFFLPPNMVDYKDQQKMLRSLLTSMKQHFRSFKVASGEDIREDGRLVEIIRASVNSEVVDSGISRCSCKINKVNCSLTKGKYKTATISLPREHIEEQFGKTMKEAAKNLHVSLSTLKRKCNVLGISEWPGPNLVKRKAKDSPIIQIDPNEKDSGATQDLPIASMNKDNLTIKAEYADDMLKFHVPILQATFLTVEKEIGMKLKLRVGTYKLKYLDEDGDWISLVSDEGMSDCIKSSRKLDRIVIRLRVLPSTQPIFEPRGSSRGK
ncbi:protein NLP7 isoform X2 [Helianthus annuus]|uniref:protein NLP7 isoform X2 n=1 Tax=Helianthus annuus TaxID=4232 RepID=UPI000B908D46|nr:protein NLP7 isoform X2 [Helianthus annuus]